MIVDFEQPISTIEGEPLIEYKPVLGENGRPEVDEDGDDKFEKRVLTLGVMCNRALLNAQEDKENAEEKLKRWELAKKIGRGDEVTIDDVALIKKHVGKVFGPGVMGPMFDLLEAAANGSGEKPKKK